MSPPTIVIPKAPQLRSGACSESKGQSAEQRRHCGHQNGPESQKACLVDRLLRAEAIASFGFDREINHQNGIFLDDPDEQNNADDRDDAKLRIEEQQREYRTYAGRRKRGKNRDRMDIALIQHAKHNADGNERRKNEDGFAFQ